MPTSPNTPCRAAQRGSGALLLMLAVLLGAGGALFVTTYGGRNAALTDTRGDAILEQAREAIIATLVSPLADSSAALRPGDWTVMPDLPVANAGGADTEPDYDGRGDGADVNAPRCAFVGWTPGTPLRSLAASQANARCFGRLAWKELGLSLPAHSDTSLASGDIPWVVISPNLLARSTCMPQLTPSVSGLTWSGYGCPRALPYPWLRVVDDTGRTLSDRVAFALILPGARLAGRNRDAQSGPGGWLDSVTVIPGCAQPCVPGTYNNAALAAAGLPVTLVKAEAGNAADKRGLLRAPVQFNDRVLYVTVDELMVRLERRATTELVRASAAWPANSTPWAVPLNAPDRCPQRGTISGELPAMPAGGWGCGYWQPRPPVGIPPQPQPPLWVPLSGFSFAHWFTNGGWHRYFRYSLAAGCGWGSGCNGGLEVDGDMDISALVLAPGAPLRNAPFSAQLGAAQTPLDAAGNLSTDSRQFFEHPENTDGDWRFVRGQPATGGANDSLQVLR